MLPQFHVAPISVTSLQPNSFDSRPLVAGIDISPRMVEIASKTGHYDVVVCGDLAHALDLLISPSPSFSNASSSSSPSLSTSPPSTLLPMAAGGCFHLVVAADTFIYVGALGGVLSKIRRVLSPGQLLAFTVEDLDLSPMNPAPPNNASQAGVTYAATSHSPVSESPATSPSPHAPPPPPYDSVTFTEDHEIAGAIPCWGARRLLPSARFAHSHTYIEYLARYNGFEIVQCRKEPLRYESNVPLPGLFYLLRLKLD